MNSIGDRLKYLRTKMNLTQQDLSNKTGIPRANISNYEKNRYKPAISALNILSGFFNVTKDWILYGDGDIALLSQNDAKEDQGKYEIHKKINSLGPIKHKDGTKVNSRDKHKIIEMLDGTLGDLMYNQENIDEEFTEDDLKMIENALVDVYLDIRDIKRKERLKKAEHEKNQLEAEIAKLKKEIQEDSKDKNSKGE